ncbi:hypothetical protein DY000_02044525 [Brassica cretica]|uniref:EAL domain-containing protein n=1 Tax=Brassica cretica TaxID=69181 RepID=A0ABQ7F5P5_BRACR|nr:hypothetical protein DY000_02044525 [Brassica cretica]
MSSSDAVLAQSGFDALRVGRSAPFLGLHEDQDAGLVDVAHGLSINTIREKVSLENECGEL